MKFLLYGGKGWIGSKINKLLDTPENDIHFGTSRCDNYDQVYQEISTIMPDRVICTIGRTSGKGIGNIDYLETATYENLRDNLFAPITVIEICHVLGIHVTYMGTGCIYDGQNDYTESDEPNFTGSKYSLIKGFTDKLTSDYIDVCLNVRIRMPIDDITDTSSKNLLTKIKSFSHVITDQNSMSYLPTLLPVLIDMIIKKHTGTINLVNPKSISPAEIADIINPPNLETPTIQKITSQDLMTQKMVQAPRSNNTLSTDKLLSLYPDIPDIRTIINKL